jgi:K+-transporting ATPase ATPase A chain
MNRFDFIQLAAYTGLLVLLTPPLGAFMARVFEGERTFLSPVLGWLERLTYRLGGVDPDKEMNWKEYAWAVMLFTTISLAAVFLIQVFQAYLPLNPNKLGNVEWASALNTAISFMTNTNWQGYAGEQFFTDAGFGRPEFRERGLRHRGIPGARPRHYQEIHRSAG